MNPFKPGDRVWPKEADVPLSSLDEWEIRTVDAVYEDRVIYTAVWKDKTIVNKVNVCYDKLVRDNRENLKLIEDFLELPDEV